MHNLTLNNLTDDQLLAFANGLVDIGQYGFAAALYQRVHLHDRAKQNIVRVKTGLAKNCISSTPTLFSIFAELQTISQNVFVGDSLATWNKILPFYDDERFTVLADKHAELLPSPNWHWNLQTVLWAVQEARQIDGDFVELGVFRGHTTLFAAEYVDFQNWAKAWLLYDTFEGIPDDQIDAGWAEMNKRLYGGTFSHEEVSARFAHIPNIQVIKGRVPEVLRDGAPQKIAFLHMDLNNSTAEIAALEQLFDRISPGGIVVFDDYGWVNARAQHDAEKAWFAARGLQILALPTGQGVFIKR